MQLEILEVPGSNILKPPSHSHHVLGIFNFPSAVYTTVACRQRSCIVGYLLYDPNSPRKIGTRFFSDQSFAALRSANILSARESSPYDAICVSTHVPAADAATLMSPAEPGKGTGC